MEDKDNEVGASYEDYGSIVVVLANNNLGGVAEGVQVESSRDFAGVNASFSNEGREESTNVVAMVGRVPAGGDANDDDAE